MAIFDVKVEVTRDLAQLYRKINYICDCCATNKNLLYGSGVSVIQPYEEMEAVKYVFNQEDLVAYKHIVLSIEADELIAVAAFKRMGIEVCELIANAYGNYQVLMAVHVNTDNLHIHFIVNTTDYIDGKRFNLTRQRLGEVKIGVSNILQKYHLRPVRMNNCFMS